MSMPASPGIRSSSCTFTTMRLASAYITSPPRLATIVTPESFASVNSIPVPTNGLSAFNVGTA